MANVHHCNRRRNWWSQDSLPWGNCCFLKRDHEAEWLEWSSLEDLNPRCWELLQKGAAPGPVGAEGDFLSHLLPDPLLGQRPLVLRFLLPRLALGLAPHLLFPLFTSPCCVLIVCNKPSDSWIAYWLLFRKSPIPALTAGPRVQQDPQRVLICSYFGTLNKMHTDA